MKLSRRLFLSGACAAALFLGPGEAGAWTHGAVVIGHGWNTLPLGAGGLVTGFDIALDGSIACRTDVGNIYRWTGKTTTTTNPSDQWLPLINFPSIAGISTNPTSAIEWGSIEIVQAPSDATKIWAVFNTLTANNGTLYYSTDSGGHWTPTNLTAIANWGPNSPIGYSKLSFHRAMVDPANPNVVYWGMWGSSGFASAVYVATDGQTFGAVSALGATIGTAGALGMAFDASSGTVVGIGGLTVTKRAIIPVCGGDVYETVDGGLNWAPTGAPTAFGTSSFTTNCGVMGPDGTFYFVVNNVGIFRYTGNGTAGGGTWKNITTSGATPGSGTYLIVDPNDANYLSQTGERGTVYGWTTLNPTATTPTWTGSTGSTGSVAATAPSYDLPWLNDIFDQGTNINFGMFGPCMKIDHAGNTIMCGNQSIWILTGRIVYNGAQNQTFVSFGRGQNATVAQEVWKPTGGATPLIAVQDFGTPSGGSFVNFPTHYSPPRSEFTCSSIEESPTDGSFVVFRITGQAGLPAEATDGSGYSTDASAVVTPYASNPSAAWRGTIHGSITSAVLTVTSVDSGVIFIGQQIFNSSTNRGVIGSAISTNPDGTGTYNVTFGTGNDAGSTLQLYADNIAGQIIAADNDHHLIVAAGHSHGCIPIVTANRGASWALCNGLISSNWLQGAWFAAPTAKCLAVGFGPDVGICWAASFSGTTVQIWKSIDFGANFSPISTITVSASMAGGLYLLAVPGQPGHLWFTGRNAGGLWQSTNYGATWTSKTKPNTKPVYMSIGAADPVSGTYPTIWMTAGNAGDPTQANILYYSINASASWSALGSTGKSGVKPDLPVGQQMYGLNSVRADRQVFKRLYCGGGQMGFCYYNA